MYTRHIAYISRYGDQASTGRSDGPGDRTKRRQWLRGDPAPWAHEVLSSSHAGHILDLRYAHALLTAHQCRQADHARRLWTC